MNYFPSKMSGLTLPHQLNGYQKLQNTHHYVYIYLRVCVLFTGILHRGFPMRLSNVFEDKLLIPGWARGRTIRVVLYIAEHIKGTQTHVFYLWLSGLGKKGGVFHKQNTNPKQGIRAKLPRSFRPTYFFPNF